MNRILRILPAIFIVGCPLYASSELKSLAVKAFKTDKESKFYSFYLSPTLKLDSQTRCEIKLLPSTDKVPGASGVKNSRLSRLSLRLFGGYADLASGDLNKDILSHDQIYRDLAAADENGSLSGEHRPSDHGLGGGADLFVWLSNHLSLGLGFEYLFKDRTSSQNLSSWWFEKSFQKVERRIQHSLETTGILLKMNALFPLSTRIATFAGAGAGMYNTWVRHELKWTGSYELWGFGRHIDTEGKLQYGWFRFRYGDWNQNDLIKTSKNKLGVTGWLGIEFSFSSRISLFLEGRARLLNLKSLTAKENFSFYESWIETDILADLRNWNSGELSEQWEREGHLEIYEFYSDTLKKTYSFVTANKDYYEQDPNNSNFRAASINLNGFLLLLGIHIKLF